MNYALILAGGIGSRFWPLSRKDKPKQFLKVCSDRPMILDAANRALGLVKKENIYLAANYRHRREVKACLRGLKLPAENFLFEPKGKNTFAPIAALAVCLFRLDPQAVIWVIPADNFFKDAPAFKKMIAAGIAAAKKGHIVALGARPERPETGYGYIKVKSKIKNQKSNIYTVEKFIEKPDLRLARKLCRDKRYFWNAGNFIFKARTMLGEIKKFMPASFDQVNGIKNRSGILKIWDSLPNISIDYAIMEKTKKLVLLPCACAWSDVGSWKSMDEIFARDRHGNIFRCQRHLDIGSKNSLVFSGRRFVATLGLDNLVVVDTDDALLVCGKDSSQAVKQLVQTLKRKGLKGLL